MMSNSDLTGTLRAFLRGDLAVDEMKILLREWATFRIEGSAIRAVRFEQPFEEEVEIYPLDVQRMLWRYLKSEIEPDQLSSWASFLTISQAYLPPASDHGEDYYEPMWYVLQQLATPELDGAITPTKVKAHLAAIEKLIP